MRPILQGIAVACPYPWASLGDSHFQGSDWEQGYAPRTGAAATELLWEMTWEAPVSLLGCEKSWWRCPFPQPCSFYPKHMYALLLQYVRVSSDTPPRVIYHLMTQHWGLDAPNLLISVTGGAKNFIMKPRLKNIFRQGLVKVAQTTGKRCKVSS